MFKQNLLKLKLCLKIHFLFETVNQIDKHTTIFMNKLQIYESFPHLWPKYDRPNPQVKARSKEIGEKDINSCNYLQKKKKKKKKKIKK